jgi:protein SCO1/2
VVEQDVATVTPGSTAPSELRAHPIKWSVLAFALLAFPLFFLLTQDPPPASLPEAPPVLGAVPTFTLVDQTGAEVSNTGLQGGPLVVDFIFTRCPNVCPIMSRDMARLKAQLDRSGLESVRFLSITVDPEHDRPEVLAAYGARFGATPDRWQFATGSSEQIDAVVKGFNLVLERKEGEDSIPSIVHSQRFVLVDATGGIRGFKEIEEGQLDEVMQQVRAIALLDSTGF